MRRIVALLRSQFAAAQCERVYLLARQWDWWENTSSRRNRFNHSNTNLRKLYVKISFINLNFPNFILKFDWHHRIALTSTGKLFELCLYSKLLIPMPMPENAFICDMNLVESGDQIELQTFVKLQENQLFLEIFDFPSKRTQIEGWKSSPITGNCIFLGMAIKMKLDVPKSSWIVLQPEQCANVYYLCGIQSPTSSLVEKVELRRISEIDPQKRMSSLIQKGLLDEAEVSQMRISSGNIF